MSAGRCVRLLVYEIKPAELRSELLNFAAGKHDDQVDALGLLGRIDPLLGPLLDQKELNSPAEINAAAPGQHASQPDVMDARPRIFTFWEPRDAITPYLRLCLRTWEKVLSAHEIIVLNYANLGNWQDDALYACDVFRRLTLPVQKDAIMVNVLRRHGGVFMDLDTIAVTDIVPVLRAVRHSELAMFAAHMAVLVARPHARILQLWSDRIEEKLAELARGPWPEKVPWDFTGNSVYVEALEALIDHHDDKPLLMTVADRTVAWLKAWRAPSKLTRLREGILRRRRARYFQGPYRKYLVELDRDGLGFMPELLYYAAQTCNETLKYQRYWFESDAGLDTALLPRQMLIGLHNSWTPAWYRRLSEAEVLAHPCLLSRTLKHLLER